MYAYRTTGQCYGTTESLKVQVFGKMPPSRRPLPSHCRDRKSGLATSAFQASIDSSGDVRLVQSKNRGDDFASRNFGRN